MTLRTSILLILVCTALGACIPVPTTHKEIIRYDRQGQLTYVELVGVDWPALLNIVERETGQRFTMSVVPAGGFT